jgi:hypothetical protein
VTKKHGGHACTAGQSYLVVYFQQLGGQGRANFATLGPDGIGRVGHCRQVVFRAIKIFEMANDVDGRFHKTKKMIGI